jgi:hypothetical protein
MLFSSLTVKSCESIRCLPFNIIIPPLVYKTSRTASKSLP